MTLTSICRPDEEYEVTQRRGNWKLFACWKDAGKFFNVALSPFAHVVSRKVLFISVRTNSQSVNENAEPVVRTGPRARDQKSTFAATFGTNKSLHNSSFSILVCTRFYILYFYVPVLLKCFTDCDLKSQI